jgi:hypothetical protein
METLALDYRTPATCRVGIHPRMPMQTSDPLFGDFPRRLGGEEDHDAVRVNVAHATLVHLASGICGLELDPHDYSVMR